MNDTPRGSRLQKDTRSTELQPVDTNNRRRRKRRKNGKALYYAVLIVLLGVLVFSSVKIITYLKDQKNAEDKQNEINNSFITPDPNAPGTDANSSGTDTDNSGDSKKDEKPKEPDPESITVNFDKMQAQYPDVVGYVYCADTVLKYPIVQTSDEGGEYYLYRDIDGNNNKNGTVFLDWRCNSDFTSQNNIIYGHNMKTGLMFASLMNYKQQYYYDIHPYFYLYTPSQTYKVNLFAGCIVEHDADVYSLTLSDSYIQECIQNSTFKSSYGAPTGNILTLSTCDYDFDNARYVVMGELVPVKNPAESAE